MHIGHEFRGLLLQLESNGEQLASLLYRIDLKPEDLPFHGNELEGKDLAMVILKREAMKVLFRKYYSV